MPKRFKVVYSKGQTLVDVPNECPLCHSKITIDAPIQHHEPSPGTIEAIFACPNNECRRYFIAYYGSDDTKLICSSYQPFSYRAETLPATVTSISPEFEPIYREAEKALQLGLTQIAGPGFRKAFEYLVKDYAKHLVPNTNGEHADIDKQFSGNVLATYVTHPRIQELATRCLWLGNDETHYLRKWKVMDVNDLVALIRLTTHFIDLEESSKQYVANMPPTGPVPVPGAN